MACKLSKKKASALNGKSSIRASKDCVSDVNICCDDYSRLATLQQQVYGSDDGRVAMHQRHVGKKKLDNTIRLLSQAGFDDRGCYRENGDVQSFSTFEDLYDKIAKILRDADGIGELTIYGISVRIGARQNKPISPIKFVYIHAGARIGAQKALSKKIKGNILDLTEFKSVDLLKGKNALEIEKILCIYKNQL